MNDKMRYGIIGGSLTLMVVGLMITSPFTAVIGIASVGVLAMEG